MALVRPSRQFAHLQEATLRRLQARIPADCPLRVAYAPAGGFIAATLDERDLQGGRYQVVAAWIDGYVAAWRRLSRQPAAGRIVPPDWRGPADDF